MALAFWELVLMPFFGMIMLILLAVGGVLVDTGWRERSCAAGLLLAVLAVAMIVWGAVESGFLFGTTASLVVYAFLCWIGRRTSRGMEEDDIYGYT